VSTGAPAVGQVLKFDGAQWGLAADVSSPYARTVIVSPVGTPQQNGAALLSAMAAISATASAANPGLLKIEPGVYDLGTGPLNLRAYVDIEGSGEAVTKITGAGSASSGTGTVVASGIPTGTAELRFLTVVNTGGATYATAIYNSGSSPKLTHVTATASGGTNNAGVDNESYSAPAMTNVIATASGGTNSYGVYNYGVSSPVMTEVTATGSGGGSNYGVYNGGSAGGAVTINRSTITGATRSVSNQANFTTKIGSSQLVGAVEKASGTFTCFGNYDGSYAAVTCP
jgi:hypothetical protein